MRPESARAQRSVRFDTPVPLIYLNVASIFALIQALLGHDKLDRLRSQITRQCSTLDSVGLDKRRWLMRRPSSADQTDGTVLTQVQHSQRSIPHRARRTATYPFPRFLPLEAFGRRPQARAAPPAPQRPASQNLHNTRLMHPNTGAESSGHFMQPSPACQSNRKFKCV
jgi:hypothetical protein